MTHPNTAFGPAPWRQGSWDGRAAGNFIGGGMGGGLIVCAALAMPADAPGPARALLLLTGMALVGLGLLCVWFEIGRPWRALHVYFHPRRSWMSREALVAPLLLATTAIAATGNTAACATPSSTRVPTSVPMAASAPSSHPVMSDDTLHARRARPSAVRAPTRSPNIPAGTWKTAYGS